MTNIRIENPLDLQAATAGAQSTLKSIAKDVFNKHGFTKSARIVFIDGRNLRYESPESTLTILLNTAPPSAKAELDTSEQIMLGAIGIKTIKQGGNSAYQAYKDENGIDLAYLDKKHDDLYIPYDMFELDEAGAFTFFEKLMDIVIGDRQAKEAQRYMWGGENHEAVLANLQAITRGADTESVERIERDLQQARNYERDYLHNLRQQIQNTKRLMEKLEQAREGKSTLDQKVAREFSIIEKHPDVSHIEVRDGKFIIHTKDIIGYASNGKYYYFGKYRIEFKVQETGVTFHGGTPRHGYWTGKDPHPHVDGRNGHPCLGNTAEAIAQLGAAHEYAALVSVAIEFLKAANTEDSAGRKVTRWDEYDMEKGVIKKAAQDETTMRYCYINEEEYPQSEMVRAFLECDEDGSPEEEVWVRADDVTDRFTWNEAHEAYIHDEAEVW